jgi:hypothetical protein
LLLKPITSWLPEQQEPEQQPEREPQPVQLQQQEPERQPEQGPQPELGQQPEREPQPVQPVQPVQQAACHMRKQQVRSEQQPGANSSYENPLSIKD